MGGGRPSRFGSCGGPPSGCAGPGASAYRSWSPWCPTQTSSSRRAGIADLGGDKRWLGDRRFLRSLLGGLSLPRRSSSSLRRGGTPVTDWRPEPFAREGSSSSRSGVWLETQTHRLRVRFLRLPSEPSERETSRWGDGLDAFGVRELLRGERSLPCLRSESGRGERVRRRLRGRSSEPGRRAPRRRRERERSFLGFLCFLGFSLAGSLSLRLERRRGGDWLSSARR